MREQLTAGMYRGSTQSSIGNDQGIIKKIIRLLNIADDGHIARYFNVTNFFVAKLFSA